ncbi:hypothetical protein Pint_07138 [Pistacia integerrima]|uniref:Uncharacterized protein n=1 Tax=Pistacia integerrima TaxID=434235 RepID=A0ACC0XYR4_9ROSI|nr:hypothetical protein Pint_07138 [Pistacia integerrima]
MSVPPNSLAGTDHLLLFYISRSYLTKNDIFYLSVVSFGLTEEGITMKVKECGLRPVYDSDIEEFVTASTNTSPEVSDPDRLAVTSTVIKRSCDYCPDQQPYPKRLKRYCLVLKPHEQITLGIKLFTPAGLFSTFYLLWFLEVLVRCIGIPSLD